MTLRRIPDPVDKELRKRAKESGRSLNRISIELLSEALGIDQSETRKRDLSEFCGVWGKKELSEFERNTEAFNSIDTEIWK